MGNLWFRHGQNVDCALDTADPRTEHVLDEVDAVSCHGIRMRHQRNRMYTHVRSMRSPESVMAARRLAALLETRSSDQLCNLSFKFVLSTRPFSPAAQELISRLILVRIRLECFHRHSPGLPTRHHFLEAQDKPEKAYQLVYAPGTWTSVSPITFQLFSL